MSRRRSAAIVLACLGAVGCGPAPQAAPERIDPSTVPFGLLDRRDEAQPPPGAHSLTVYFVGADRLVAVEHPAASAPDAAIALRRLLDGPTAPETELGLGTLLPTPQTARVVGVDGRVARVDLSPDFHDGTIPNQATALAQIVLTLTELPEIDQVSFLVGEQIAAVPRGDGSLTRSPVRRDDYASLAPSPTT